MILHEHRLPADDSHEFLLKKRQNLKLSSAANYMWRFKGQVVKIPEICEWLNPHFFKTMHNEHENSTMTHSRRKCTDDIYEQ